MAKQATAAPVLRDDRKGWHGFWLRFKRNKWLHLMMVLPMAYIIIFQYLPMYGLQIAFRDYRARAGIWGSEWVGLANFREFFGYYKWPTIVKNTLGLSLYSLVVGFPIPIVLALMIHVNEHKRLKKLAQNISYIPHFISTVVMVGILFQVLNPVTGIVGSVSRYFGVSTTTDFRYSNEAFRHLYVWSGVWQNMGWSTIIYVSALSSVSQELHEAATIDGASRLRRVFSVDLPAIMPTVAIMLILRFGSIMSVGYEKVFLMQSSLNLDTSEIISTYVYKFGLGENKLSYGAAVNLMNSVINTTLLLLVNKIASVITDDEVGLL